jgi:hypothetical protein
MPTDRAVALEAEEWYVLVNWLRSRENQLMYAVRSRSREWEQVYELRQSIENQLGEREETRGVVQRVTLSESEVTYLSTFLRRRSLRLRFLPWRDRERRDVVRMRRQLLDQV